MNLRKKKILAARTLDVGKDRIVFNTERLADINEAITKQDIRDLLASGAIALKEVKGRKVIKRRKLRRRGGSIRQKKKKNKRSYVILTRKLRAYIAELRRKSLITQEAYLKIRKEIKASAFKSRAHLKEIILTKKK